MQTVKQTILFFTAFLLLLTVSCKKDKKPAITVPEVTTNSVTAFTSTTANGGGTIVNNGGETISASGVCWSTDPNPTISNDTTKGSTASGSFTATLTGLTSSTTYYARAYAINRIGVGYGEAKQFMTGNAAPTVSNVVVTGTIETGQTLTATYSYNDNESDVESGTTFKWYVADDANGSNETSVVGATASTFILASSQFGKFIRVGVTPKAATGNKDGTEVKSPLRDGEPTSVTFTYKGQEVTYGVILSNSGKKWLDRNLGATRVAQTDDDYQAYGDLFQWGRPADGHQYITRTGKANANATPASTTTTTKSPNTTSPDDKFVIDPAFGSAGDWLVTQNDNLWQGVNGLNNPCPAGWRIPTQEEWVAEDISSITNSFDKLKLTYTGSRSVEDGNIYSSESGGSYWSSTTESISGKGYSVYIYISSSSLNGNLTNRGAGVACRCIKD